MLSLPLSQPWVGTLCGMFGAGEYHCGYFIITVTQCCLPSHFMPLQLFSSHVHTSLLLFYLLPGVLHFRSILLTVRVAVRSRFAAVGMTLTCPAGKNKQKLQSALPDAVWCECAEGVARISQRRRTKETFLSCFLLGGGQRREREAPMPFPILNNRSSLLWPAFESLKVSYSVNLTKWGISI